MYRKTVAVIDLDAIRDNFLYACRLAPQSRNIAVIKADAYGHGAVQVAKALQDLAPAFAVAMMDEAVPLRENNIDGPVLVLEGASDEASITAAIEHDCWLVVHNELQLEYILAARPDKPLSVWIKIDTGMSRLGFRPEKLPSILERLQTAEVAPAQIVVCTHLACAEELSNDKTHIQTDAFRECAAKYKLPISISNSAGIMGWPETHAEWNRPGYMLYGISPFAEFNENAEPLKPAMTLRSELIAIRSINVGDSVGYGGTWVAQRPSIIGTVEIGYADGYPRSAANGTPTLINDVTAPLVGTVSMDMVTIDLTDVPNANIGDSVILWGEGLSVNDIARHSNTIGYELLTRATLRVPRTYVGE